jgi:hypothetical protein
MTDETRILRTVGIPIVIAVIMLFVLPKMCGRVVEVVKARQEKAKVAGLHIESSQKPVSYPAGLDADRVRYLIEIDNRFATPYTGHVVKQPRVIMPGEEHVIAALQKLGYVEAGNDGALTLTRDGMLHLDGLVDEGTAWTFPLAKRQFQAVTSIDSDGNTAHAGFAWQWQPNTVGAELIASPKRHDAKAELTNSGGRWTLTELTVNSELE